MEAAITTMFSGTPAPLGVKGALSSIRKSPHNPPWTITSMGLAGDIQADTKNHGGPEKALHHYPFDHYEAWLDDRPELADMLAAAPAFGENISTSGVTEATTCIGDVYGLGRVRLQISQGRQPCWKLNERFGWTGMARAVQASGRTGWYYRVLEPGIVEPGTPLLLIDRPRPDWPLARLLSVLYQNTLDYDELAAMSALPELAQGWRGLAARRVANRTVEGWAARLGS